MYTYWKWKLSLALHFIDDLKLGFARGRSIPVASYAAVSGFVVVVHVEYGQTADVSVPFDLVFIWIWNRQAVAMPHNTWKWNARNTAVKFRIVIGQLEIEELVKKNLLEEL